MVFLISILLVLVDDNKRKGMRIGNPIFCTNEASHMLLPPLLKYSLPKSVPIAWPHGTKVQ